MGACCEGDCDTGLSLPIESYSVRGGVEGAMCIMSNGSRWNESVVRVVLLSNTTNCNRHETRISSSCLCTSRIVDVTPSTEKYTSISRVHIIFNNTTIS